MPELKGKTADGAVNWTYTGDVVDGKRHGKGKCIYDNDDVYDGEWQNDQWHGVGELTTEYDYHASVRKYKGHFANGQLHGTGIGHKSSVLFANNYSDSYEGEWRNGRPEGKGTMKSAAGSIQGEWEGNVPKAGANMTIFTSDGAEYYNGGLTSELHFAGFGRVTKRDGQESQTITCTDWFCNKPTGTGTWDYKDAEVDFHFKGELNDDKSKGHAHIKNFNEDGSVKEEFEYDGELFYFNPHGVGRRVFVDGRVEEGKFTHGDFQP